MSKTPKNKTEIIDSHYRRIWFRFNANLGSLWVFSREMTEKANEWDQALIEQLALDLANLFDDDPQQIQQELSTYVSPSDHLEFEPAYLEDANVREVFQAMQSGEFKERALVWIGQYPQKQYDLLNIIRKTFQQPPANGIILRRSAFVTLVSFFEFLLTDLLVAQFLITPTKGYVPPSDLKTENEREAWVREALEKDRSFQPAKAKQNRIAEHLQPSEMDSHISTLNVLRERRNLIAHKDGIIDKNYLDRFTKSPEEIKEIQYMKSALGRRWLVSNTFLLESLETINFLGILLIILSWKKSLGRMSKQASRLLVDLTYFLLTEKRYALVVRLGEFSRQIRLSKKELYEEIVQINHAIALQRLGRAPDFQKHLRRMKESNFPQVRAAKSILDNHPEQALIVLEELKLKGELNNISFDWPLFDYVRDDPRFRSLFEIHRGYLKF